MIKPQAWMSEATKGRLRAVRFMQDTLWLVEIAKDEDTATSALFLVESLCREITERGLAGQSELINKACGI